MIQFLYLQRLEVKIVKISENKLRFVYVIFMLIIIAIANFWPDPKTRYFAILVVAIIGMTFTAVVEIK